MDTQLILQNLSTWPAIPLAQASRFFRLPKELRILIYEFVFTSEPSLHYVQSPVWLPESSLNLIPLLTSRQFYQEAKLYAFQCTTHNLDRLLASCVSGLLRLQPDQRERIRHVALCTRPVDLYKILQPFRDHLDHIRSPPLALDSLTIILDMPLRGQAIPTSRVQEQNEVLLAVWYYKNVKRVIVANLFYREAMREYPGAPGLWDCLNEVGFERDEVRWRVELTNFHDYSWKPHEYLGFRRRPDHLNQQ
ncbi:hypothetical protein K491DRAFT_699659 [Lophiostoma macrostomum CBS 122681]|uniref:Uncharacterized protein n=1 Tax=Lophiostoma macrostomum CBS 122681 TaxID=1314788 RepID=A0A6A6SJ20_9PLEO|nr:hypothetical protein K491DRAFT_699659 [Lophiostoma macrostomum CBS 122681]